MRTYYISREMVITDRAFVVRREPPVRIPLAELTDVQVAVADLVSRGRTVLIRTAGGALAVALISGPVLDSPTALLVAVVTFAATATVNGTCYRRTRRRVWELTAVHRGRPVCLYRSTDARTFGQVRRAMMRALEDTAEW